LARQAIDVTPTITNPAHRYPASLITLIQAQLDIVNDNQPIATGGDAQAATAARNLSYLYAGDRVGNWLLDRRDHSRLL